MAHNNTPDVPEAFAPEQEQPSGLKAFVASKLGRMVLGGAAVLLLLAGLGVAANQFVGGSDDPLDVLVPPAGAVEVPSTAVPPSEEETVTARGAQPLSSTFAFRDVFVPTVKPTKAPSANGTSTAGTNTNGTDGDGDGGGTTNSANTLLLRGVSTENGEPVATFLWNGQTYTLGEGERLGDTPWQVVSISGNTVIMLYGDSRVSLTVGQGITK